MIATTAASIALSEWVDANGVKIQGATPSMLAQVVTDAARTAELRREMRARGNSGIGVDPSGADDPVLVDRVAARLWQVRPLTAENLHAIARLVIQEVTE